MVALNNLPSVAQPAMQEGKYVGMVIRARLAGHELPGPFQYSDRGSMATIGHRRAVAESSGIKFTGMPAYMMWGFVHVMYLIGWGNRLGTIYTWARALYLSKNRGHRIISFQTTGYEVAGRRSFTRSIQPYTAPDSPGTDADIHGREDQVIPLDSAYRLLALIERSELHVFGRCGHWSQIEWAADFNALLIQFLSRDPR
jgi:NADH dehydrogenase